MRRATRLPVLNTHDIGLRLKAARERLALTQGEVAHRAHVKTVGTVSNLELGKTKPEMQTLAAITFVLGLSLDYVIGGERRLPENARKRTQYDRRESDLRGERT